MVLRGRGRTGPGGRRAGPDVGRRRWVLRAGLQALGAPVHVGRRARRRPIRQRAVHVRGRRVRARVDAPAHRLPAVPQVPVPDRTDRLLRAVVGHRRGVSHVRASRVDRSPGPVLLADGPAPAVGQDRRQRVSVVETHHPAGDQQAQASDPHHSYVTPKRTDRIFIAISV